MSDAYQRITDSIIERLEQGVIPWHKPWRTDAPKNYVSGKPYRGVNHLVLGMSEYDCAFWATFKQIKSVGGSVQKGQKGTPIVFVNMKEIEDKESGETVEVPFLRQYVVFNLEQTDLDIPVVHGPPVNPLVKCDKVIAGMPMKPSVTFDGGNRAYYDWHFDSVHMPRKERFESPEELYSTFYHELVHSTGHEIRLDRPTLMTQTTFGSDTYSREELCAELGACFLCAETGISNVTIDNSASYVGGWLKALKNDKRMIVQAAAQAEKACDFILDRNRKES